MSVDDNNDEVPHISPSRSVSSASSNAPRDGSSSVQVAVRVRPLLAFEEDSDNCVEVLHSSADAPPTVIRIGGSSGPRFTFDQVFDSDTPQDEIFKSKVVPLIDCCLEGYNATILAYGQTGSGKTFSIMGKSPNLAESDEHAGIIPRAVRRLFDSLSKDAEVRIQFLELYGEEIRDLLVTSSSQNKLTIRDLGNEEPEVVGATQQIVTNAEEAMVSLKHGMLRRVTGATAMNESSSRSHAILSVLIEQQSEKENENLIVTRSKFNFVDLAGSERQKKTQAEGKRLKEGIDINKGLLVLGNVISALGDPKKRGKSFVPYRDSKLTRLLKGSLGGNHKTLMIACVSPSSRNMEESLNCLRYANRAKNIQNNAIVNLDPTSRMLADLQGHVQVLARNLLQALNGQRIDTTQYTVETLETLAAGKHVSGLLSPKKPAPATESAPRSFGSSLNENHDRIRELEDELNRTHLLLEQSRRYHDTAEEQLYIAKAEKEMAQLQLSVSDSAGSKKSSISDLWMEKAIGYEKEIGRLREALRSAEAKANARVFLNADSSDDKKAIERAKRELQADRRRLKLLRSDAESGRFENLDLETDNQTTIEEQKRQLDIEEHVEQEKLSKLTRKYLSQSGISDDEDETSHVELSDNDENDSSSSTEPCSQRVLKTDLVELTRSISAKEELITQLMTSQEKYASMRDFYEEKIRVMDTTLQEKEAERAQLIEELNRMKDGDSETTKLREKLVEKEKHISILRQKQQELKALTSVSSKNETDIMKLQRDVEMMKRKKVELQKQLNEEKKARAGEIKRLQKVSMQKDREISKVKNESKKRELEANRATQVAKARLEELGHLRAKYKDAEKKIRMLSLKRGVMAKAGLDPVIVGRRQTKSDLGRPSPVRTSSSRSLSKELDADVVRDYFDQKVAEIVRKEALVDKLAAEWEEHFELNARKEQIADESDEDTLQALDVQLQFKEQRIRQLAQRLGKQHSSTKESKSAPADDGFLFDSEFAKLCSGTSPDVWKATAAKVLFGMIVRERRRISALARTASSLDERLQEATKAAQTSEAALRSYMDEQRLELANLTQNQQKHILSLMEMVRQDSDKSLSDVVCGEPNSSERIFGPTLLVLANERITVLEQQLRDLQSESDTNASYREKVDELKTSLESKTHECDDLQNQLGEIRSMLRQLREQAAKPAPEDTGRELEDLRRTVLESVKRTLHPTVSPPSKIRRRSPRPNEGTKLFSMKLKKHIELMHTSDSAEELGDPQWATEIMADLELIAAGKVPPSLGSYETKKESVFDRLADPQSFTGTQKQVRKQMPRKRHKSPHKATNDRQPRSPPNKQGTQERQALSKEIASRLDQIVIPTGSPNDESKISSKSDGREELKEHRSVFDRLMSPSQYTGTQKEKFHETRPRKAPKDGAEKLLDDLLRSDNSFEPTSVLTDYTQQDVFERLQRTTTQAYAVKQNGSMPNDLSSYDAKGHDLSHHSTQSHQGGVLRSLDDHGLASDYTSVDVFERLQKTTTEAYALRMGRGRQDDRS